MNVENRKEGKYKKKCIIFQKTDITLKKNDITNNKQVSQTDI